MYLYYGPYDSRHRSSPTKGKMTKEMIAIRQKNVLERPKLFHVPGQSMIDLRNYFANQCEISM